MIVCDGCRNPVNLSGEVWKIRWYDCRQGAPGMAEFEVHFCGDCAKRFVAPARVLTPDATGTNDPEE